MPLKRGGRERRQITDGPYPQPVEAAGGHRAHTPQSLDRQWVEELEFTGNLDHDDSRPRVNTRSVSHRFGRFRRQFRQQLVRCHSYRTGQMQVVLHTSADVGGDARAIPEQAHRPRHIEKRLVDGDPFDQRRHRFEDGVQFGALFHVTVVSAVDEYGLRTQSAGDRRGHGGMDTGRPARVGSSNTSTEAKNASMSTWSITRSTDGTQLPGLRAMPSGCGWVGRSSTEARPPEPLGEAAPGIPAGILGCPMNRRPGPLGTVGELTL